MLLDIVDKFIGLSNFHGKVLLDGGAYEAVYSFKDGENAERSMYLVENPAFQVRMAVFSLNSGYMSPDDMDAFEKEYKGWPEYIMDETKAKGAWKNFIPITGGVYAIYSDSGTDEENKPLMEGLEKFMKKYLKMKEKQGEKV